MFVSDNLHRQRQTGKEMFLKFILQTQASQSNKANKRVSGTKFPNAFPFCFLSPFMSDIVLKIQTPITYGYAGAATNPIFPANRENQQSVSRILMSIFFCSMISPHLPSLLIVQSISQ